MGEIDLPPLIAAAVGTIIMGFAIWSLLMKQVRSNIDLSEVLRQNAIDENKGLKDEVEHLRLEITGLNKEMGDLRQKDALREGDMFRLQRETALCHTERDDQAIRIQQLEGDLATLRVELEVMKRSDGKGK